jgi:thiamine kinase-like enzyme
VASEVGRRLAALHQMRLNLPQELTLEYQVNKLQQYISALAKAFQQYAERCNTLHAKLQAVAAHLEPRAAAPIHASFKFSHTFLTNKGIAFIDFDGANLGDPGHDVGSFVAYLYKMAVEQKLRADVVEQTIASFCEAYNQAANSPISKKRSDWFSASHIIVSHIYKSIKRLDSQQLDQFLQVAEGLVKKL